MVGVFTRISRGISFVAVALFAVTLHFLVVLVVCPAWLWRRAGIGRSRAERSDTGF